LSLPFPKVGKYAERYAAGRLEPARLRAFSLSLSPCYWPEELADRPGFNCQFVHSAHAPVIRTVEAMRKFRRGESVERLDVLLVCSTGGHLIQLDALREAWAGRSHAWVTFDKTDARSLLRDERVFFAYGPTNRSLKNLIRNTVLAVKLVGRLHPRMIVSTGAGVAVPFAWVGRVRGARTIYIESFTRINGPSLSGRLISPVAERVYVQWPEMSGAFRRARFVGTVFGGP
jgi:beta-1,4-N-acetylglucosaminyltransferase